MRVVIEGVRFVAGNDLGVQAVNGHIHNAELGVILHLFLPKEGHGGIGVSSELLDEVRRGDEHAAATAGRVQHGAVGRFNDVHNHADKRLGCKEHTVVRCHGRSKLIEEVFVDTPDDVILNVVQSAVIEDAEQFPQEIIL